MRCITLALLTVALPNGVAAPAPSAREVADRVAKAYAACKTYRDAGSVTAEFTGADGKSAGRGDRPRQFTTVFQRGGAFRFEYKDPNPRGGKDTAKGWMTIVWAKGEDVKVWPEALRPVWKPEDGKSVHFALFVLAGVTEGTSTAVPLALFPSSPKARAPGLVGRLKSARLLGDERVGKADCFRLRHAYDTVNLEDGSKFRVTETCWIARGTYLIRRVRTEMAFKDKSRVVTTIDYDPAVDVKLDPAQLAFRPPQQP
jgi:hypothetical protein